MLMWMKSWWFVSSLVGRHNRRSQLLVISAADATVGGRWLQGSVEPKGCGTEEGSRRNEEVGGTGPKLRELPRVISAADATAGGRCLQGAVEGLGLQGGVEQQQRWVKEGEKLEDGSGLLVISAQGAILLGLPH